MLTAAEIADFASPPMRFPGEPDLDAFEDAPLRAANDNYPPRIAADLEHLEALSGFVYVGTPYTNYPGGRGEAARLACVYAAKLMRRGLKVFSPIAHSHPIARYGGLDETDHFLWVAADRPFVEAANSLIVVMMDGWAQSRGLAHEIDEFIRQHKPILYVDPRTL